MRTPLKPLIAFLVFASSVTAWGETLPFVKGTFTAMQQEYSGQKIIISFWSETCSACMKEMGYWSTLKSENPELGILMVSTDSIENKKAIESILADRKLAELPSWAFADDFLERLYYDVDPSWHGELPLTFLVNEQGITEKIMGLVNHEKISTWVKK